MFLAHVCMVILLPVINLISAFSINRPIVPILLLGIVILA